MGWKGRFHPHTPGRLAPPQHRRSLPSGAPVHKSQPSHHNHNCNTSSGGTGESSSWSGHTQYKILDWFCLVRRRSLPHNKNRVPEHTHPRNRACIWSRRQFHHIPCIPRESHKGLQTRSCFNIHLFDQWLLLIASNSLATYKRHSKHACLRTLAGHSRCCRQRCIPLCHLASRLYTRIDHYNARAPVDNCIRRYHSQRESQHIADMRNCSGYCWC